ncbi:hypothetical protein Hanom_Chr07g00600391 [Helianthus anomalus]
MGGFSLRIDRGLSRTRLAISKGFSVCPLKVLELRGQKLEMSLIEIAQQHVAFIIILVVVVMDMVVVVMDTVVVVVVKVVVRWVGWIEREPSLRWDCLFCLNIF